MKFSGEGGREEGRELNTAPVKATAIQQFRERAPADADVCQLTWLAYHPSVLAVATVVDSPAIVGALGQIGLVARASKVVQPDGPLPLSISSKPAHRTPTQYINPSFIRANF